MRYRKLSSSGDYTFGHGTADFFVDQPEVVGQAVATRLRLLTGEWFVDISDGTPYSTEVLGKNTVPFYDYAIQQRILGTDGCTGILKYSSSLNPSNRALTIDATITTRFGTQPVSLSLVVP